MGPDRLILPDLDIWLRAFDRRQPDLRVVSALSRRIEQRQIVLLSWVRQGILARLADERQAQRLRWALAGFPDIRASEADQVAAAERIRGLRRTGVPCGAWPARLWTVAARVGGIIWSQDRRWQPLMVHGCPVQSMV